MAKKAPRTPAVHFLLKNRVSFTSHFYSYLEQGGTSHAARELGVDEHTVIKTLIMEDELERPFLILMNGDLDVSTKSLARVSGRKKVTACSPATARRHTGYQVGGISPFGIRKKLPFYLEETIMNPDYIYINGGRRGFLVGVGPGEVCRILQPQLVKVGIIPKRG